MITTPIYGWPYPELGDDPHGPDDVQALAQAIENTLGGTDVQSYTPTFINTGAAYSNSNGTSVGKYRVWKGWCSIAVHIVFGSAVVGGTGTMKMTLPVAAAPTAAHTENWLQADLFAPSRGHWSGSMLIVRGATSGNLYFNRDSGDGINAALSNANTSNTAGTGVPLDSGNYTIRSGGYLLVAGRYRAA